jgi:GNAT superfamily N-acetyltransferase
MAAGSSSGMRIEYLADHLDLVPELARLHFGEWGHLRPEQTLGERTARLRDNCGRGGIPTVFVGLIGSKLCGSALLVEHDMDTRPELTPWLAGVYVLPEYRRRGCASILVERVTAEAEALGVPEVYLYTPDACRVYSRLGWSEREQCRYLGQNVVLMSKRLRAGARESDGPGSPATQQVPRPSKGAQ